MRCSSIRRKEVLRIYLLAVVISSGIFLLLTHSTSNQHCKCSQHSVSVVNTEEERRHIHNSTVLKSVWQDASTTMSPTVPKSRKKDPMPSTQPTPRSTTEILKEIPFEEFYKYPLSVDMPKLVKEYKERHGRVNVTPINEYPYAFSSSIPKKCGPGEPVNLLLMVKSAVRNLIRRTIIRETWGNQTFCDQYQVKIVFVLGTLNSVPAQKMITQELSQHGDIIQIDYLDSYYNNTKKTTGAIRWATKYCRSAKFIMTVDDDFYAAPDLLVKELMSYPNSKRDRLFMGNIGNVYPGRDISDKWHMTLKEYPYALYPPFVRAAGMTFSMKVAIDIDIAIRFTEQYKFDDVYIGMVCYKLGIKPMHNKGIQIHRLQIHHKNFNSVLVAHQTHGIHDMFAVKKLWKFHIEHLQNSTNTNDTTTQTTPNSTE